MHIRKRYKKEEPSTYQNKPTHNRVFCVDCGRHKCRFDTEEEALRFIEYNGHDIYEQSGKAPVRAYPCVACGGWHITSRPDFPYSSRCESYFLNNE